MKSLKIILVSILIMSGPLMAENIGFVDLKKVFDNYKETKIATERFEKKQAELRKELEKKQKQIEKAQDAKKDPDVIRKLVEEIQEDLQPKREELMKLNNQLMAKIRTDIIRATNKVSKKYGVDLVLDKQAILTGGFDLTDFVIEDLNNK